MINLTNGWRASTISPNMALHASAAASPTAGSAAPPAVQNAQNTLASSQSFADPYAQILSALFGFKSNQQPQLTPQQQEVQNLNLQVQKNLLQARLDQQNKTAAMQTKLADLTARRNALGNAMFGFYPGSPQQSVDNEILNTQFALAGTTPDGKAKPVMYDPTLATRPVWGNSAVGNITTLPY